LTISPVPPNLEENEMPESARKTAAAIEERAIKRWQSKCSQATQQSFRTKRARAVLNRNVVAP
jgi:hypothetical protein